MNDKWTHVQPIIDKIDTDLIERVPYTKDTWENIDIGREVLLQIMRDPADDLDDSDMSSEADADGKLGSDDIKPKKPSSPSSEGGRSSGSRSIADEEGDHMDEEPEDEEKDESEGGDEHEEEDFDEPESESAGSASDDDDDDEEGEEEDDEKAEGADSEEPEKEESDVETGSKMDADAEIDGDIDEKVVGDDKAAEFDDDDEEEEEEGKDTWKPSSETEFLDHSIGDLDDAMSEEISVMARASAESSDYVIPTTDHDLIEPAPIVCSQSVAESRVVTLDKEVRDVASAIQLDFERAFVSQQKSYWKGGQTRGAINPSQLSRIRTGDMRVFRTREVRKTQDFDVQLVIDCSGSMHGTRMKLAIEAAYAMGVALDSIGINFEIIGFTSRDDVHLEGTKRDDKFAYARLDAIYMPVFKDFGEIWSPTVMQRLASWSQPSRGVLLQNVDGESLMLAAKRLAGQPSSGKAMIVLSDGSPCCSTESSAALIRHLKKTTKMIENAGINLVGIGIQHSGVGNYFTNYTVLHELSTLPTTVVSKVRDIILGL
ncbi:FHA domain protein [Vibrio maritimus]|uniref:FHA domain protein n=1 Tax=Vibrio maritimus TaxID=990268 RepID=A0A090S5S7_9VIBR|nr:FHA domain protein [Vibrio maritimus]